MLPQTVTLDPATEADWSALEALVNGSGLPLDGLAEHLSTTFVAHHNGQVIGSVALEPYGTAALLRSLAVEPTWQNQRIGISLVQVALEYAQQSGAIAVYLLTETSEHFFARHGFQVIHREDVPASVQASVEFTSACPAGATAMRITL